MMKLRRKKSRLRPVLVSIVGVILIAVGGAFVYRHYFTPPKPVARTTLAPTKAKAGVTGVKKSAKQKASYEVPANHPRELIIPKLGIDANILSMGVLADGSLEAPQTAWDVGWYNQSGLPGTGSGALLVDGHVNDQLNSPGVFYSLHTLQAGDELEIQRGDKQLFTYKVVDVEQKPIDQVDMAKMMRSAEPGKEGLNLITCGGQYDYSRETYDQRVLVYAVRTS